MYVRGTHESHKHWFLTNNDESTVSKTNYFSRPEFFFRTNDKTGFYTNMFTKMNDDLN